jgi:hypothetical protein
MPENKAPATTIQTTVLPNILFIINLYSIRQRGALGTTLSLHWALLQNKASAKSTQLLLRLYRLNNGYFRRSQGRHRYGSLLDCL